MPTTVATRFAFFLNPKNILRYITYKPIFSVLCKEIYLLIFTIGVLWPNHLIQT